MRDYDAVTLLLQKRFLNNWQLQASYTWSYLRGNYDGLFRPEDGQTDPNTNSTFDLISLIPNSSGALEQRSHPQHQNMGLQGLCGLQDRRLEPGTELQCLFRSPHQPVGAHFRYGGGQAYVLPRGNGGRLPWTHGLNLTGGTSIRLGQKNSLRLSAQVSNVLNLQQTVAVSNNLTFENVLPTVPQEGDEKPYRLCATDGGAGCLEVVRLDRQGNRMPVRDEQGEPTGEYEVLTSADVNPQFGRPTAFQSPISVLFTAEFTF